MREEDMNAMKDKARMAERNYGDACNTLAEGGFVCAGRMSARAALRDKAERLRREAMGLEALAAAIPDNYPADADTALWNLVYR